MNVCVWGGVGWGSVLERSDVNPNKCMSQCIARYPPLSEGASNQQPVLCHAGVVSAENWSIGEHLYGGDANALAEARGTWTAVAHRAPPQSPGGLWMLYQSDTHTHKAYGVNTKYTELNWTRLKEVFSLGVVEVRAIHILVLRLLLLQRA